MENPILSGLILLLATIVTIVFAYYTTIIIGKKTNKLLDGRYTQILERTIIGLNTNITILKINQKIYIIALQGKSMELIDIIDEENWKFLNNKNENLFKIKDTNKDFLISKLANKLEKAKQNLNNKRDR